MGSKWMRYTKVSFVVVLLKFYLSAWLKGYIRVLARCHSSLGPWFFSQFYFRNLNYFTFLLLFFLHFFQTPISLYLSRQFLSHLYDLLLEHSVFNCNLTDVFCFLPRGCRNWDSVVIIIKVNVELNSFAIWIVSLGWNVIAIFLREAMVWRFILLPSLSDYFFFFGHIFLLYEEFILWFWVMPAS